MKFTKYLIGLIVGFVGFQLLVKLFNCANNPWLSIGILTVLITVAMATIEKIWRKKK